MTQTKEKKNELTAEELHRLRVAMLKNGYAPLPNKDKRIHLKDWGSVEIDEAKLEEWKDRPRTNAVGLRLNGTQTCGIDVDVEDGDWIDDFRQALSEMGGNYARLVDQAPVRYGGGERELWLFRTEGELSKIQTPAYRLPGGDDGHRVEIYGGASGRQFGVYGAHSVREEKVKRGFFTETIDVPVTHYRWKDDYGPADFPAESLPVLTLEEVEKIRDVANQLLAEAGGEEIVEVGGGGSSNFKGSYDDCIAALRDPATEGHRRDVVGQLTRLIVSDDPDMSMEEACETSAAVIDQALPDGTNPERRRELTEVKYDPDSELVRWVRELMPGGSKRHMVGSDNASERLERALLKLATLDGEPVKPIVDIPKENTPKAKPKVETPEDGLLRRFDIHNIEKLPRPIIHGFIREGEVGAIVGMSNVGKTNISALWSKGVSSGRGEIMGLEVDEPLVTAWFNAEEETTSLENRLAAVEIEHGIEGGSPLFTAGKEVLLSGDHDLSTLVMGTKDGPMINEELVKLWIEELGDVGCRFLNIEPITEFHGGNENAREDARLLYRAVSRIAERIGATLLYWGHTGKRPDGKRPDWYRGEIYALRGSGQLVGNANTSGTVTPYCPGKNVDASVEFWNESRRGLRRNVVDLTLSKPRMGLGLDQVHYEIASSQFDAQVPVAKLFDQRELGSLGGDVIEGAIAKRAETERHAEVLFERLKHEEVISQKKLRDITGMPSIRWDREEGQAILARLRTWRKFGDELARIHVDESGDRRTYRMLKKRP